MLTFWQYIKLGFDSLAAGKHPTTDPFGNDWPPDSRQAFIAGKPIAGGKFTGAFWSASSDLEYAVLEWGVPHWSKDSPCLQCACSRSDMEHTIRDYSMSAGWRSTLRSVRDGYVNPHPIWSIEGASAFAFRGDWMHTVDEGVLLYWHASVMHDLLTVVFVGTASFEHRLGRLWMSLQRHFEGSRNLRHLSASMIG